MSDMFYMFVIVALCVLLCVMMAIGAWIDQHNRKD